jgi:hypothetical protein
VSLWKCLIILASIRFYTVELNAAIPLLRVTSGGAMSNAKVVSDGAYEIDELRVIYILCP